MTTLARTRLARAAAGAALAGAFTLAGPAVAQASTIYPPAGSCTATPTTTSAGGTVQFECAEGTFSGDEEVTITVTGENGGSATIGMVRTAISTVSDTAPSEADGSLAALPITFPTDASGTYNIAAVSPTSAGGTATVTVTTDSSGLPVTGLDSGTMMGLWIGGGALLLAGGALAITAVARRRARD
ncbi:cell wall protein [Microbacterium sp. C7(2022)]|uniref:cell wall protein n=1 Tax=Microbacterium sp. C7(2022) TaxID=2992759 RepID=UPI00237BE631|nr:cell wall protein [Microbacterium sp. C7(2022)]MDE0545351.1 cell wall protein [Microbacterium sp. C7(2022)]